MEAVFDLGLNVTPAEPEGNRKMELKLSNRESINCAPRKKLADISNLPQQPKEVKQSAKLNVVLLQNKEQIEKLQKENIVLTKAVADRNRIIDFGAIEMQKLRIDMQKLQEKNLQLAQANNQMLAELNSGKDKIKILQHDLDCKTCLLKVRQFVLEVKDGKHYDAKESSKADRPPNTHRRRQQRSQSWSSLSAGSVPSEENVRGKRPCRRRQSAALKSEGAESSGDSLEMGKSNCNVLKEFVVPVKENHPEPSSSSLEKDHEENNDAQAENQSRPRSSVGRPLRRAVEKVQSYKEIPINVKMRRQV